MQSALKNLTLRQLRALAATVAGGSITTAAGRLGVTQPAVSLQLQNLQDLTGLPLIQRGGGSITATDAGRILLELEQRIQQAMADCIGQIAAIKGITGGRVAIGAVSTAKYFAPATIGAFARKFPQVELKLTIGNRAEIIGGLTSFALDVAITGRPPDTISLEKQVIGEHPHVIIAAPDHRLAQHRHIDLSQLATETFIMREPGSGTRLLMQSHLEKTGFSPKIGMEIDSNETIKQAVMAGLGIAFLSGHTIASEVEQNRLITLDVRDFPLMRQWFVVCRQDKHLLPPARALLNFMATEAKRFLPLATG